MGNIRFIGKKHKSSSSSDSLCHLPAKKYDARTVLPTQSESDELFSSLAECDSAKPAVLAIVSPYCDRYIPAALPLVLSDLYQKEYLSSIRQVCSTSIPVSCFFPLVNDGIFIVLQ